MRNQNRFGKLRFSYAWFVAAMIGLASIASCSSGGCGNCTVPAFHAPTPSPIPVVATPTPTPLPPGVTPTPTPPGVTPTPTATPTSTPTPTPTPVPPPVALSCAANPAGVPLGTAANFAILGAAGVTNTGPSIVTGDLGTFPTASVTGFTTSAITGPGIVIGAINAANAVAGQGQTDLTVAYNAAAGKASTISAPADIGGLVLAPGVYKSTSTLAITGNVTLNSQGNPNAVFVFQIASGLTANVGSSVTLVGGNPCNIYWQVGSSATLNGASFSGNVLALASVTVGANNNINGRLLARTGAVTLISDAVTKPGP